MLFKNLIFDFDGTIINSFRKAIEIGNDIAIRYGYPTKTYEEMNAMTGLTLQGFIKTMKVNPFKIPKFIKECQQQIGKAITEIPPIEGICNTLKELVKKKYFMAIVTSNVEDNVVRFLKKNDIDIFDELYAVRSIFGKHKNILKLMQKHGLLAKESVYIGDETRDIEAARKSGIKVIAVSWGYNNTEALKKQNPDYLVSNQKEFFNLFK